MPSNYYSLTDANSDGIKSQELPDTDAVIYGFKKSAFKVFLYTICNILTIGLPYLIARWYGQWKIKFQCVPCSLRLATVILLKDDTDEYFVCNVQDEAVQFFPEEFSSRNYASASDSDKAHLCSPSHSASVFRHFTFRYEKFVWDDREKSFRKIQGLDDVTCQHLLENFTGLSHSKRLQMKSIYGANIIEVAVKSYFKLLVNEVLNPFYIFQIFSVMLWCFDEYIWYATCVIIISAISIAISLIETKRQSEMLRDMAEGSGDFLVTVLRCDGEEEEISSKDLVPGDVVLIPREGCIMPCDAVVINGTCIVNESMLTGESIPVSKSAVLPSSEIFNCDSYKRHTVFCGTQVIQTRFYAGGKVSCVVVRTGYSTLKGQLIRSILFPKEVGFTFYSDAMKFVLILFCLAAVGMIGCIYMYIKRNASLTVLIVRVLDVVTIVVPPALPAAMTVGTVYAQARLRKRKIYCISPPRINFCGKLKLVCFDKTGTLTEDGLDFWCAVPYDEEGDTFSEPVSSPPSLPEHSPLLRGMASCHSLTYIKGSIVGDPLDLKMFSATEWELEEPLMSNEEETKRFDLLTPNVVKKDDLELGIMKEFEFTPQHGRMSVAVRPLDSCGPGMVLYCKGAPERIRLLCSKIPENFDKVLDSFTIKGYRVLAMAWKPIELNWHQIQRASRDEVEMDLNFSGFLVMQNSLKPATNPVIQELNSADIRCVMVTGDNMLTALSVARECGMIPTCDKVIIVNCTDDGELEFKLASQHYEAPNDPEPSMDSNADDLMTVDVDHDHFSAPDVEEIILHASGSRTSLCSTNSDNQEPLLDMDRLIPITSDSCSEAIVKLHESNYHFVLNGQTWSLLQQHCSPDILELIVAKGTVYARMAPESKRQLVESLQDIGYIVAMCGDGANDCSALKMAHVGISLSEAEASVAAPFTSKVADVSCVPHLIREGRCALVTSFGIFKYMALYSMVQFISVLTLYACQTNLADTQFLYIDLGITTTIAVVMGRTEPYSKLVSKTPMGSLVSFQNIFSIVVQIVAAAVTQLGALLYLNSQPWFVPVRPSSGNELITLCWETTTIFSISCFQYLILALVFSKGPPFRKHFYTNGMFLLTYAILTVITTILVIYPYGYLATFFHLEPVSETTSHFRWTILMFPVLNFLVSLLLENCLAGSWIIKRFGKLIWKKNKKNRYKEILQYLDSKRSWPPITS